MTMYSWRIAFGVEHPETGGSEWAHKIVRAPTAADALTIFNARCAVHPPQSRYFRGPEHVECFEPAGAFGVWDKHGGGGSYQKGGWLRDRVTGDIRSGDYRWADGIVAELATHGSAAQWVVREFREEAL